MSEKAGWLFVIGYMLLVNRLGGGLLLVKCYWLIGCVGKKLTEHRP
jgi:hypothetical protein